MQSLLSVDCQQINKKEEENQPTLKHSSFLSSIYRSVFIQFGTSSSIYTKTWKYLTVRCISSSLLLTLAIKKFLFEKMSWKMKPFELWEDWWWLHYLCVCVFWENFHWNFFLFGKKGALLRFKIFWGHIKSAKTTDDTSWWILSSCLNWRDEIFQRNFNFFCGLSKNLLNF